MLKLTLLLAILSVAFAAKSYEGYQIWTIQKDNLEQVNYLASKYDLDVLSEGNDYVKVILPPTITEKIRRELIHHKIHFKVNFDNIQPLIDAQKPAPFVYDSTKYNTIDDINTHLEEVAAATGATVASIGNTVEGRPQNYIRFDGGEKIIWIDCGIHAREWISPATCMHGVDLFADSSNEDARSLLSTSTVYIMPVWNPDGYAFSHTDDRLWRKNRNPNVGELCRGVDLNRNFDDHWSEAGTSDSACSQTYHGASAGSEIETQNGQTMFLNLAESGNFLAMYSIHSYSQLWLYPYGYSTTETVDAESAAILANCTEEGVNTLEAMFGTQYDAGPIATTIYPAAGTTVDYAYTQAGVRHSYTLELRDLGEFGFELPEDQILPTAQETWAGLFKALECAVLRP